MTRRYSVVLLAVFSGLAVVPQMRPWDGDAIDDRIREYLQAQIAAGDGPCANVFEDARAGLRLAGDTGGVHWDPDTDYNGWADTNTPDEATIGIYPYGDHVEGTTVHEALHAAVNAPGETWKIWDDVVTEEYPKGITKHWAEHCAEEFLGSSNN